MKKVALIALIAMGVSLPAMAKNLDELNDVTANPALNGDILSHDGAEWLPRSLSTSTTAFSFSFGTNEQTFNITGEHDVCVLSSTGLGAVTGNDATCSIGHNNGSWSLTGKNPASSSVYSCSAICINAITN